jgi:hypothetical protein
MQKTCKECGMILDVSFFTPSKVIKDGYENKCKICRQKARRKYKNTCEICGNEFYTAIKATRFCSNGCKGKARQNRIIKECSYCGKHIEVKKYKDGKQEYYYCNQSCRTKHLKMLMKGENNPNFNRIEHRCDGCGKTIQVIPHKLDTQKYVFCSNECYKNNIGKYFTGENNVNFNSLNINCSVCGKEILRSKSEIEKYKNHYCSKECSKIGIKAILKLNNKLKINATKVKCNYCNKEIAVIPSKLKNREHIYCSLECKNKGWSKYYSGENSPNWNSNITEEERLLERNYEKYYNWRKEVFLKDKYTCQCCGYDKGGNLVAHHILNYSEYEELRTELSNGITLCKICHKKFHDLYGYRNNNNDQLNTFIQRENHKTI